MLSGGFNRENPVMKRLVAAHVDLPLFLKLPIQSETGHAGDVTTRLFDRGYKLVCHLRGN